MASAEKPLQPALRGKVCLSFGIALSMVLLVGVISHRSTQFFFTSVQRVSHARQVLENQEALLRHLTEAESGARGYAASDNEDFLRIYQEAQARTITSYNSLRRLVLDNPAQSRRVDFVRKLVGEQLAFLKTGVDIRHFGNSKSVAEHFGRPESIENTRKIREVMGAIENEERQILLDRTGDAERMSHVSIIVISASTVLSCVLLVAACIFILRDINARKQAEERFIQERNLLHRVIDALPDEIFVKDLRGRYMIDNAAHRRTMGLHTSREVEGKSAEDFYPVELAREFRKEDQEVVATGRTLLNLEKARPAADGHLLWHSMTKVPLKDPAGKIIGIVGHRSNITERKNAEETLRLTAAQLERNNRELQDFAAVASHDLQEPLRKILAFSDRLKMKYGEVLGVNGGDYLERVMDAARRMQNLIQGLLTLARVTSRAQPFVLVDLCETVWDVVSDLEVRIEQTGAKIEVGTMPVIEADPVQIRQLIQNLISNALKFQKPETAPVVKISAKVRPLTDYQIPGAAPGDEVCQIVIQDNGIGFDEKFTNRIFQVFQRLHGRNEYEGTGIGLAVVRKIIDRHGGSILAKSSEGEGATFIVTLPVKQRIRETHEEPR